MDTSKLANWLQICGNLGLLAGIVLVAVQINQASHLVENQLFNDQTADNQNFMTSMLGEAPAEVIVKALKVMDYLKLLIFFLPLSLLITASQATGASRITSDDERVFRSKVTGKEIPDAIAFREISSSVWALTESNMRHSATKLVSREMAMSEQVASQFLDELLLARTKTAEELDATYESVVCHDDLVNQDNTLELLNVMEDIEETIYRKHYQIFLALLNDPDHRQKFADWVKHEKWGSEYAKMDYKVLWGNDVASANQAAGLRCESLRQEVR